MVLREKFVVCCVMKNKVFTLEIEKSAQGGDGFAHLPDGRACFVQGALPSEKVIAKITESKRDYTKAETLEVLVPHSLRVAPRCPYYGQCGGCSLQHADFSLQKSMAEESIRDTFRRFAREELPENFVIHSGNSWEYRNRIRVQKNRENVWGFRAKKSHQILPVAPTCPILVPKLREFLKSPEALAIQAQELQVFENGNGEISYYYNGMSNQEFSEKSESVVEIAGKKIHSDASVFFQSNLGLLPVLVKRVLEEAGEGSLLVDLFSGVGFFATILEDSFEKIVAVERDSGCLRHAVKNLKNSAEFITTPAEDWLQENMVSKNATLIVDPPRTGLPQSAVEVLLKSSLLRLIYVSCNPVTLARDLKLFKSGGFSLDSLEGFAFYPQTPHLEMLAVLSRK